MSKPSVNDIPDNELVGRAVRSLRTIHRNRRPKVPIFSVVMDVFCLGSTYSAQLCRKYGIDPDERVRPS